jgi:two-component system, response regulator PdtaR
MSDAQHASSEFHLNWETTDAVAAQSTRQSSLRVLVVEDEWSIGILFAETIASLGHSVCAIATTEEGAVTAAALHDLDLMIVDGALGAGSGLLAVEQILRTKVIPHVFVTGDRAGILAVRPDAVVIEKPFRVRDLAAAIRLAMATNSASTS